MHSRTKVLGVLILWVEFMKGVAVNVEVLKKALSDGRQQSIYFISNHIFSLETIPENKDYQQLATMIQQQIVVINEFFQIIRSISRPLIIIEGVTRSQEADSELLRYQPFFCTCVFQAYDVGWCSNNTMSRLQDSIDEQRRINSLLQLVDFVPADQDVLVIEPKAYLNDVLDIFFMIFNLDVSMVITDYEKYQACTAAPEGSQSTHMFVQRAVEVIDQLIKDSREVLQLLKHSDNKNKITSGKKYLLEQRKLWQNFRQAISLHKEKPFIEILMETIFKNRPSLKNVSIFQLKQGIDSDILAFVIQAKFLQFILNPHAPLHIIINTGAIHTLLMTEYLINEGYTLAFSSQIQCNWGWVEFNLENYQMCLKQGIIKALDPEELNNLLIKKIKRHKIDKEL